VQNSKPGHTAFGQTPHRDGLQKLSPQTSSATRADLAAPGACCAPGGPGDGGSLHDNHNRQNLASTNGAAAVRHPRPRKREWATEHPVCGPTPAAAVGGPDRIQPAGACSLIQTETAGAVHRPVWHAKLTPPRPNPLTAAGRVLLQPVSHLLHRFSTRAQFVASGGKGSGSGRRRLLGGDLVVCLWCTFFCTRALQSTSLFVIRTGGVPWQNRSGSVFDGTPRSPPAQGGMARQTLHWARPIHACASRTFDGNNTPRRSRHLQFPEHCLAGCRVGGRAGLRNSATPRGSGSRPAPIRRIAPARAARMIRMYDEHVSTSCTRYTILPRPPQPDTCSRKRTMPTTSPRAKQAAETRRAGLDSHFLLGN